MFIKISQTQDKYFFEIGDLEIDSPQSYFSSIRDNCLIPTISSKFNTFLEAKHYANEIVETNPTLVLAKKLSFYKKSMEESGIENTGTTSNDKIIEIYGDQVSLIQSRFIEIETDVEEQKYKPEEQQKILTSFVEEIDKITNGIAVIVKENDFSEDEEEYFADLYHSLTKIKNKINSKYLTGKDEAITEASIKRILMAFGESAASSIIKKHPLIHIESIYKDKESDVFGIVLAENKDKVVELRFNNSLLLNDVIPLNNYNKTYTEEFLKMYWKPIVNSVGHFFINASSTVLVPTMNEKKIYGFNKNGKTIVANIEIKNEDKSFGIKSSWWIKISQNSKKISDYTEDELIGAEVICVDKKLPTYYQRSGNVVKMIPRDDYVDLVIDFRRGLDKLVLKDDQVKLVNLPT